MKVISNKNLYVNKNISSIVYVLIVHKYNIATNIVIILYV